MYPSYLIHFNKLHSKANGQFISGDGDGDGILNDHLNRMKAKMSERRDSRWAKRNYNRLYKKAYKPVKKSMERYVKEELNPKYSSKKIGKTYINEYNRKLAELMNSSVSDLPSAPSGRVVQFIAKRGDIGVHMALTVPDYDISGFKNGIYDSGRVAYKKNVVEKLDI